MGGEEDRTEAARVGGCFCGQGEGGQGEGLRSGDLSVFCACSNVKVDVHTWASRRGGAPGGVLLKRLYLL